MDIISNNVANVDTNGFKRRDASFTELLSQQFATQANLSQEAGRHTPVGVRQGTGAKLGAVQLVLTQGALQNTGRELDFSFSQKNQFLKILSQVNGEEEIAYTRNGALYLSPSGGEMLLVDANGNPVLNQNDEIISLPSDSTSFVLEDGGRLTVETPRGEEIIELGVVAVQQPQYLEQKGNNLYGLPTTLEVNQDKVLTDLIGAQRESIGLQQGFLEKSNVDLSKEMTDLITVQRSFQFQTKSISIADQMMGLVNGIR